MSETNLKRTKRGYVRNLGKLPNACQPKFKRATAASLSWPKYNSLVKPSWTPAPGTIGMIWSILYPIIIVSFGFVFVQAIRKRLPWLVAVPFAINLVANMIFTPIQFGMRNLPLAAVDILIVWSTILWCMIAIWPHYRWVALAQMPYLIWVSLATTLQLSITWANR
jgi:tryptophan-rich sensory protein